MMVIKSTEKPKTVKRKSHIGKLSYKQVESLLYSHYEDETSEERRSRTREGDLVAARIVSILDSPNYPLKITSLTSIHKKLFYAGLDMTQIVKRIASFTSCLWQAWRAIPEPLLSLWSAI